LTSRLRALAILGASALGVSTCGASRDNGVGKLRPMAIIAQARAAADRASSVHAVGSIRSGRSETVFDLYLVAGVGARGRLSEGGVGFRLIELGGTVYVKGSRAFYERFAGRRGAHALGGKWLRASTAMPGFTGLASLTRQRTLVDTALGTARALESAGTATVDGEKVVALRSGDGGTYAIAATGTPYPVEVTRRGGDGGRIAFDRWGARVDLIPPPKAVDVTTLKKPANPRG